MNIYWVYDLPIWLFGALTIAVTVAIALGGFYATRKWARRVHRDQHSHNDIVGFYLGAICLFYGITLGLLAAGTWQTYSELDAKVGAELQADLREYARQVIDVAWPLQRRGIVPQNAAGTLEALQTRLASFEPTTEGQKTRYAETYREFDRIVELRRIRLKSVVAGLPMPLWSVVLVGAFITIAVTWFFDMRSQSMHFWMTIMFSGLLGLLIFLLAGMDNPFRGDISVGPEAFELVYKQLMQPGK